MTIIVQTLDTGLQLCRLMEYGCRSKKKTAHPVALWMEPANVWPKINNGVTDYSPFALKDSNDQF